MSIPAAVEELISDAQVSAYLGMSVDDRLHVAPV